MIVDWIARMVFNVEATDMQADSPRNELRSSRGGNKQSIE